MLTTVTTVVIAVPLVGLAVTKLIDMFVYSIAWDLRFGRRYSERFHQLLRQYSANKRKAIEELGSYGHDPMRLCRWFASRRPRWAGRLVGNYIYRWPSIVFLCSMLLLWTSNKVVGAALALVLCLLIVAELLHQLVSRLTLGVADNINKYAYLKLADASPPHTQSWTASRVLRDAIVTLLIQIFCITVGYAAIYHFLNSAGFSFGKDAAFSTVVDALYFSTVVTSTVGFGDIVPVDQIPRALVISHIAVVWVLVFLLLAHYFASLSVSLEDEN